MAASMDLDRRCMIVDDQSDMRVLVRMVLETADHGIVVGCEAANGLEALEQIEACDPYVIIMDEAMPGMCGVDAAVRIKERRPHQSIVLFSAYVTPELRARAADEAGIRVCLAKEDFDLLPQAIRLATN